MGQKSLRPSPDASGNLVTLFPSFIGFFEMEITAQPPVHEQGVCQEGGSFFCGAAAGLRQHDASEKRAAACKPAGALFFARRFL
jgi:hypothetical protein